MEKSVETNEMDGRGKRKRRRNLLIIRFMKLASVFS